MKNMRTRPQSSATPMYLSAGGLALLGLVGMVLMLVAMADVPRSSYFLLIGALVALIGALIGALALIITTNTRRPWGIDPNEPMLSARRIAELNKDEGSAPDRIRVDWNQPGKRRTDLPLEAVHEILASIERQATEAGSGIGMEVELPAWVQEKLHSAEAQEELRGEGTVSVRRAGDEEP